MKVVVIGFESSEDVSKKTGRDYAIGKVYAAVKLDGRNVEGKFICKGAMGTEYGVDPSVVKKIAHLDTPFEAELLVEDVMRFGKRESKVLEVRPISRAPVSAAAGRSVVTAAA